MFLFQFFYNALDFSISILFFGAFGIQIFIRIRLIVSRYTALTTLLLLLQAIAPQSDDTSSLCITQNFCNILMTSKGYDFITLDVPNRSKFLSNVISQLCSN